jgi:hypothetical protein
MNSERLKVAISYLQKARELIEAEAKATTTKLDALDLEDAADDIGPILFTLESFEIGAKEGTTNETETR